jgi:hemoglobin
VTAITAYNLRMKMRALCAIALLAASTTVHAATLFDQLGGEAKLRPAVDELVNIMLDDDRINFTFAETDLQKFKGLLYDQLCQLSDGPCVYQGRDMFTAHQKLKVKNAQFNALTEDLYRAMSRVHIPYRVQNKLVAKLAPMQRDIVK